jgi:ribosomal protein S18 acetylase RimI-like enzyme
MIFVPATPADVEELVRFVNGAYRGETAEAGWASEGKLMAGQRVDSGMLANMLSIEGGTILLMRDQVAGCVVGCVSIKPTSEASTWYLSMLAVDPQRQAGGLGRLLLTEAEDRIKAQGATRVKITVIWLREPLIEWYERRGYRRTGQTEPFPYEDQRFGVPLRNDLYFVELDKPLE